MNDTLPEPLHVALNPVGSHGDVHPFVGLGVRLMERGHRVTMITNGHFEPLARKAGIDFLATSGDEEFRRAIKDPDLWHPRRGFDAVCESVVQVTKPAYEHLARLHAEHGDRLVSVGTSLGLATRIADEALGIPAATAHLAPSIFQSVYDTPRYPGIPLPTWSPTWAKRLLYKLLNAIVDRRLAPPMNEIRGELGLPPVSGIFKWWWNSPRLVLAMFPEWYAAVQPDWPANTHAVGFPLYDERGLEPLPAELERFLASGTRPIAFTPGSAMVHGREFFAASAEACRLADRRGVLLTRHREQVPESLPPGVIHVDYAPFSELLPRCAAVVHHGGIGSSAQALAGGCPQLVHPFAHDQFDNAARLERLGVGRSLRPSKYTPARAAAALNGLIESPEVGRACAAAAARLQDADALGAACELIEGLVNRDTPTRERAGAGVRVSL